MSLQSVKIQLVNQGQLVGRGEKVNLANKVNETI